MISRIRALACALVVVITSGVVFAGGSTGGGNVVECQNSTGGASSMRLLDYYEAELLMPELARDLGNGKTVDERVEYALDRLEDFDKSRADRYRKGAANFMSDTRFVTKVELPSLNDHDYVPLEQHCKIRQLAIQNISPYPQAKKFTIRQEFWNQLTTDDKAGLILHELIYEEAMAAGQKNSRNSRYFNAVISSAMMGNLSQGEYEARVKLAGLDVNGGVKIAMSPVWSRNPLRYTAKPGHWTGVDLNPEVRDVFGKRISCSMKQKHHTLELVTPVLHVSSGNNCHLWAKNGLPFLGEERVTVTATNEDGLSSDVEVIVEVVSVQTQIELPKAAVGVPYTTNIASYFKGQCKNGGTVKFAFTKLPTWLKWSGTTLVGTPAKADLGDNKVESELYCGNTTAVPTETMYFNVEVVESTPSVQWTQDPIWVRDFFVGATTQIDMNKYIHQANSKLMFRMGSGMNSSFTTISSDGYLRGTPTASDVGEHWVIVEALTETGESVPVNVVFNVGGIY